MRWRVELGATKWPWFFLVEMKDAIVIRGRFYEHNIMIIVLSLDTLSMNDMDDSLIGGGSGPGGIGRHGGQHDDRCDDNEK